MVKGIWSKIDAPALLRSSHSVSIIGDKAYIFGGEIKPREPVSNSVHVIDLKTGQYEEISGLGEIPEARVGHTAAVVNDEIYVFGGRGGAAMTPLEESGSVYAFAPKSSTWRKIDPASKGEQVPQARSYHCSTATSDSIIIHAGCGNADVGRLNDLWAFNVTSREWSKLPNAPGDPRGGSAIAFDRDLGRIWRFGGFNGKTEVGGVIDHFTFGGGSEVKAGQWASINFGDEGGLGREDDSSLVKASTPGARSVTGLHILSDGGLVTFFGEGKPSPTGGHDAAGNFWGDVWLFDAKTEQWTEVEQQGEGPGERGWFGSDAYGQGAVVWGGIDSANDRIPDGWVLRVEQ